VVRVRETLIERHSLDIPYSTLTRLVREAGIKNGGFRKRAGSYHFLPGDEMQHDTSPHQAVLNGKKVKMQCAALVFAYSREAFVQYYPRFTRFEAKVFLRAAMVAMGGACTRCVIDNTSVIVAGGSGPDAIIAPEMEAFGAIFGIYFQPHRIGHADRKGRVERFFRYVEGNFLAGRTFSGWQDLNNQAVEWCQKTANQRYVRRLGMTPKEAGLVEKPSLKPLPQHVPPIYKPCQRIVDVEGYITLDTNRYSVPEKLISCQLEVHMHWNKIKIYHKNRQVAKHQRIVESRHGRVTTPGHHKKIYTGKKSLPIQEEDSLKGRHDALDEYLQFLKKQKGYGRRKLKALLHLYRTYPLGPFLEAVSNALHYGLHDLKRLEKMIIKNVASNYFNLVDEYENEDF